MTIPVQEQLKRIEAGTEEDAPDSAENYDLNTVIQHAIMALLAFGPVVLVMKMRREPWASAGVTTRELGRATLVGAALFVLGTSVVLVFHPDGPAALLGRFSTHHLWSLAAFAIVGFGEEFAFRGYLQTRLVAWLGTATGWVAASLIMALAHVVQRMAVQGLGPVEALLSSLALLPISLFAGYVMLRTGNVMAPGLFHTMANWAGTL